MERNDQGGNLPRQTISEWYKRIFITQLNQRTGNSTILCQTRSYI